MGKRIRHAAVGSRLHSQALPVLPGSFAPSQMPNWYGADGAATGSPCKSGNTYKYVRHATGRSGYYSVAHPIDLRNVHACRSLIRLRSVPLKARCQVFPTSWPAGQWKREKIRGALFTWYDVQYQRANRCAIHLSPLSHHIFASWNRRCKRWVR